MKTRIDYAISEFVMSAVEEGVASDEMLQKLLDVAREQFDLDVVYILERINSKNLFTYRCASVSRPEYDQRGVYINLPDEEYDTALHMYDDDPVCGYNVDSVKNDFPNNIIHFGFVRKEQRSYDGSIGFQSFSPHVWTEEERWALIKLGNMYKAILSVSLADGVSTETFRRLELEFRQYRDALVKGSEFSSVMDVTDGLIREKVVTARGTDIVKTAGLSLPAPFDDVMKYYMDIGYIEPVDKDSKFRFTREDLLRGFEEGFISPEWEYYKPKWDRYVRLTAYLYRSQDTGHVCGLFAATDVTGTRLKEARQRQALEAACDAANQANEAKSRFLSSMSHDIRTPMNGIIGMTAIAGAHLDDRKRVEDCLAKINAASKHLLGLINEILDMSKIESGRVDLAEECFSLSEFIDNVLSMSKSQIEAKKHDFSVSITNVKHEKVIGDSQRLEQVFMNLLSNAVKYTPEGGRIKLSILEKPVRQLRLACYEFIFEDNGIGMSEEFQQHLFEPFTRADDARVGKIQGTGLGMAITKNIVQMMNGSIHVESSPDNGSKITVTVFLKLQDVDETASYEKFIDLPILVADDDLEACEYTCCVLTELGMKSEYVLSGAEAVELVDSHHKEDDDYYAVILDWKMPDMDGLETTRQIRRRVGDDMPIIIISAYDQSEIEQEARKAGANAFISKPLFKSRMAHLFHELMGSGVSTTLMSPVEAFQQKDFSGRRALLAEDNELNAEIAGEIFGMVNLSVEYAKDGKEALEMVAGSEEGYYDVIFMDIQMPVMNGYDSSQAIRALPRTDIKEMPIIAMTANAFAEDALAAKSAGMNEYITKPIDFNQLLAALNKWLS